MPDKSKLFIIISVLVSIALLIFVLSISNSSDKSNSKSSQNISSVPINLDGKQLIELNAKGGYSPAVLEANAGVPIVLRVKTNNTFDCSAAISIPQLNIRQMLPSSGNTDILIPAQNAGSEIQGTCSMGMYSFSLKFK